MGLRGREVAGLSKRGCGENTQAEAPAQGAPVGGGEDHVGCSVGWLSPKDGDGGWGMVEPCCLSGTPPSLPTHTHSDKMLYFRHRYLCRQTSVSSRKVSCEPASEGRDRSASFWVKPVLRGKE